MTRDGGDNGMGGYIAADQIGRSGLQVLILVRGWPRAGAEASVLTV